MTPRTCPACGTLVSGAPGQCLRCRSPLTDALPDVASAAAPAYRVFQFQAGRGGPMFGVYFALVVGLGAALVLGVVAAVLRQFFWIVLLFPAGFGGALGYLTSVAAALVKCRRVPMIHGAGVVVGFVGAATLHFVMYLIAVGANDDLRGVGFFQYLDLRCQAGVLGFGYTGTAIYYVVEAALIVLVAAGMSAEELNGPFCDACNRWKRNEVLGKFAIHPPTAAAAVAAGQPDAMVAPAEPDDTVTIELFRCPHCRDNGAVEVRVTGTRATNMTGKTPSAFVTYPGEAAPEFEAVARNCREQELEVK